MGERSEVAFQLPTSDGPTLCDTEGRTWRYLTYPPESPQAKIAAQENHEGRGACYWYHDDRDQATRYLIPASGGLPCRHHDVALTGDGVVKTDKRWHIAPEELETEQRWGAETVREIVGRGVAVPVFAFKVSDLLAVREALGHPSVDIQPIGSEVRDIVIRGLRIAEYWREIWYHRSDEERMAQPNRSAHYRQRIETLRRMRERFEADGYSVALLDQGYDLDAAGEFGGRFVRGIKLGAGSENYSRYWQIGQWAETAKTGNPTDTDTGPQVDQDAVNELLDW